MAVEKQVKFLTNIHQLEMQTLDYSKKINKNWNIEGEREREKERDRDRGKGRETLSESDKWLE